VIVILLLLSHRWDLWPSFRNLLYQCLKTCLLESVFDNVLGRDYV
jgi:hypothetical protein